MPISAGLREDIVVYGGFIGQQYFDIKKRSGKTIDHLYSVYMDFNVAPSTMYVLKENEDAKKLYISYSCSAPETNSQP